MRQTKKYTAACEILAYPHSTHEQLYLELNRLGWWWDSKKQIWERNDAIANKEASGLLRIRVWGTEKQAKNFADLFIEFAEINGLKLQQRSDPYPYRPPNQGEFRIYLTFTDKFQYVGHIETTRSS